VTVTTVRIQKNFLFFDDCDTHIVKLEPLVSVVVFYVNEVVTTFGAAIVNTNSMQCIGTLVIFNRRESLVDFFV